MPRSKIPKELEVDGTAKLAKRSKPNDKHEKHNLNIEEATIASPRDLRKRSGDYFDFEGEGAGAGDAPSKPPGPEAGKPKKKTTVATKDRTRKSSTKELASTGKEENGKSVAEQHSVTTEAKPNDDEAAKDGSATNENRGRKSKRAAEKDKKAASPTAAPDLAMDQAPFQGLLENEEGKASKDSKKRSGAKTEPPKSAKGAKPSKAKPTSTTAAEAAAEVKKDVKAGAKHAKKLARAEVPETETASSVANAVSKEAKAGAKIVKKTVKGKNPTTESISKTTHDAKQEVKSGVEKAKNAAKSKVPASENTAKVVNEAKKIAKNGAEKAKNTPKPTDEAKSERSNQKKRKASSGIDAAVVKTDILDPLSEHAEESAKKKQKKDEAESTLIRSTVGGIIASAAESAKAARHSLGGLASSFLGGASESADSAKETLKNAKGKGKAIVADKAESVGKALLETGAGIDETEDFGSEPDDHTAALVAGFESEGDDAPTGEGFQEGQPLPKIPEAKQTAKKLKAIKKDVNEQPGVIYVGRIPHGFHEHEMRQYFSQFGEINRLRLSRNKKTGASRHYAFIEFKSSSLAQIVADTMDNYLMFGHILKCKIITHGQLHNDVWKGADKRFKKVPWNRLEGKKLEAGVSREHWQKRIEGEEQRRTKKQEKTKAIGYEFEAPNLRGVEEVPKKIIRGGTIEEERSLITAGVDEEQGLVVVSEEVTTKKLKKGAKGEVFAKKATQKTKRALEAGGEAAGSVVKKAKKAE
ncbi:hypothetical protein MMC21_008322 [Puttea exsequens]|nr:hypothetical protein [Puttea exsequens]